MNIPHLHLLLNHIPLFFIPIGMLFLVANQDIRAKRWALALISVGGILSAPVYFTGEEAEEVVENQPLISEQTIEAHEEAAETALPLSLVTSLVAFVCFFRPTWDRAIKVLLILGILSTLSLGFTAYQGGKIRHPEIISR